MLRVASDSLTFFHDIEHWGLGQPTMIAYATERGIITQAIKSHELPMPLSEPWVLVWFAGAEGFDKLSVGGPAPIPQVAPIDVPWLFVLQHQPRSIQLTKAGLVFTFADDAEHVACMPFFGLRKPAQLETARAEHKLPREWLGRARLLARLMRAYPIDLTEAVMVGAARDDRITIVNDFQYLHTTDDWNTPELIGAPIPPIVALAATAGLRVEFEGRVQDLKMPTAFGPMKIILGSDVCRYTICGLRAYIDQVETYQLGRQPAVDQGIRLIEETYRRGLADPNSDAHPAGRWSAFADGMSHVAAEMCYGLPYIHDAELRAKVTKHLQDYFSTSLLNPARFGIWHGRYYWQKAIRPEGHIVWDDDIKFFYELAYPIWCYAHYTGDWELIRARWDHIKNLMVPPFQITWAGGGPQHWAFGDSFYVGALLSPLGLARMAAHLGDQETYAYACWILARVMTAGVAVEHAADFIRQNEPWNQRLPEVYSMRALAGNGVGFFPHGLASQALTDDPRFNEHWYRLNHEGWRFIREYAGRAARQYFNRLERVAPDRPRKTYSDCYFWFAQGYLFNESAAALLATRQDYGIYTGYGYTMHGIALGKVIADAGSRRRLLSVAPDFGATEKDGLEQYLQRAGCGLQVLYSANLPAWPIFGFTYWKPARPQKHAWQDLLCFGTVVADPQVPVPQERAKRQIGTLLNCAVGRFKDLTISGLTQACAGPYSLAMDPAGKRLYVACLDTANIAVLEEETLLTTFSAGSPAAIALTEGGQKLLALDDQQQKLVELETTRGQLLRELNLPGRPRGLVVSAKHGLAFINDYDAARVKVLDLNSFLIIQELKVAERPAALAVDDDSDRLYVACNATPEGAQDSNKDQRLEDTLAIYQLSSLTKIKTIPVFGPLRALAISPRTKNLHMASAMYNMDADIILAWQDQEILAIVPLVNDPRNMVWGFKEGSLAISPVTGRAYLCGSGSASVATVDETALTPEILELSQQALRANPTGKKCSQPGSTEFFLGRLLKSVVEAGVVVPEHRPTDLGAAGLCAHPHLGRVYVANFDSGTLTVINEDSRQTTRIE